MHKSTDSSVYFGAGWVNNVAVWRGKEEHYMEKSAHIQ